ARNISGDPIISQPLEWCSPHQNSSYPSLSRCSTRSRSRRNWSIGCSPIGWWGARKAPKLRRGMSGSPRPRMGETAGSTHHEDRPPLATTQPYHGHWPTALDTSARPAEHPAMKQIDNTQRLPADVDAQPLVQAAAALRSVIRGYREEIEREQRLPKALVEQFHAAGFYSMVIPRPLGGLQVDPLTYLRVVELLAEAAGSVGWNLANNSIAQLVAPGLPDEGVREISAHGPATIVPGTAVMGGGRAVPVDGGYRVTGRWPFGTGCQESAWMLGSFQILDGDQPRRSPDGSSIHWRGVFERSDAQVVEGTWDVSGLRATGSFD